MSDYQVNPITVNGIVEEMKAAGAKLQKEIDTLKSLRTELNTKWEGPASLAYDQVFDADIRLLEEYYDLLLKYVQALHENALEYVATEDENVQRLETAVK